MKTLQILRHAKTEPQQIGQQDFQRRLTSRGLGQMADLLQNRRDSLIKAEDVWVSSAVRTQMTLKTLSDLFPIGKIHIKDELYLASTITLIKLLQEQDDSVENFLLIGHNDGLSELVSYLADDLFHLPTSGYVVFELPVESWAQISQGIGMITTYFHSDYR